MSAPVQPLYNLFDRDDFEAELQALCVERGVSVIPFFSLASGFLTGKYRFKDDLILSLRGAFVKKYLTDAGLNLLSVMDGIAEKQGASNVQIALAWLLAQPSIAAPIASATSVAQLDQLAGALEVTLDADDLKRLDEPGSATSLPPRKAVRPEGFWPDRFGFDDRSHPFH